jgi:hypothetical protein
LEPRLAIGLALTLAQTSTEGSKARASWWLLTAAETNLKDRSEQNASKDGTRIIDGLGIRKGLRDDEYDDQGGKQAGRRLRGVER